MRKQRKSSFWSMLPVVVIILAGMLYLVISLNTQDFGWFLTSFNAPASAIFVNCYGERLELDPLTAEFQRVDMEAQTAMSSRKRWDQVTMSEVTLENYLNGETYFVVELHYDPPAGFHSNKKFYKLFDRLFIPLDGTVQAQYHTVSGWLADRPRAGSFAFESFDDLVSVLDETGICSLK